MLSRDIPLASHPDHCKYCFALLECELRELGTRPTLPPIPNTPTPLFVTWETKSSPQEWDLRGCIGTLSPASLRTALGEYAIISALQDSRFDPISLSELPTLRVSVSLLVNYEDCSHVHDWVVGQHGIIISFASDGSSYSATYLPEVAQEQGWSTVECVNSLIRKAGYRGIISDKLLSSIKTRRYTSHKSTVTYDEYKMNPPILAPKRDACTST